MLQDVWQLMQSSDGRNKILNSTILDLVIGARIRLYT